MSDTLKYFALYLIAGLVPMMGADWPQWRGPLRNGVSQEKGLLQSWPAEGPKLLWQVAHIGSGYSTPAVVGEHIYLAGNEGMENESVLALRVADGTRLWSTRLGKVGPNVPSMNYPGSRSTPTVVGELLYVLGSDGDLACVELSGGKIRWQKNLRSDFDGKPGNWAYSESPLVDGEIVVCTPGGTNATVVALNRKSGEVVWKCAVPGGDEAAYASAIVVEAAGVKQYVQFLQKGLIGIEASSGKFLWRYGRTAQGSPANIPTPLAEGDLIYNAAGRSGGALIKLKRTNGGFEPEQIFFTSKMPTAIGGAVKVGNHLYGTTGQALVCGDFLTGELRWESRSVAPASILFADGRLYLHGENGEMALVEATPEGYHERGRFAPPGQPDRGRSKAWAYPVVANGRLYIRDMNQLWCYDIRAGK
ncbi:MAG: PQQ-binding-like beta-propeller repeat protein [Verrucomicrobiota bacterium]